MAGDEAAPTEAIRSNFLARVLALGDLAVDTGGSGGSFALADKLSNFCASCLADDMTIILAHTLYNYFSRGEVPFSIAFLFAEKKDVVACGYVSRECPYSTRRA